MATKNCDLVFSSDSGTTTAKRIGKAKGFRLWGMNTQLYAGGLFFMHDTEGFPLECSLDQCIENDFVPCLGEFEDDAYMAGWSREKAAEVIRESIAFVTKPIPESWHVINTRYLPQQTGKT